MDYPLFFSDFHRDYTSISPSARFLILVKGFTGIPYARELAELFTLPENIMLNTFKRISAFWQMSCNERLPVQCRISQLFMTGTAEPLQQLHLAGKSRLPGSLDVHE